MAEGKKIRRVLKVGREISSSLSSFVERPLPTEKEVAVFEKVVRQEVHEQEIDSNLSEIYSDQKGEKVDVSKMDVKKRAPFLVRFIGKLLVLSIIGAAVYFAYSYWFTSSNDLGGLEFNISAPESVLAGESFTYQIEYRNPTKYPLTKVRLEVQYPIGFIYSSSSQEPVSGNHGWDLDTIAPGAVGRLTITGRLFTTPDSVQVIFGNLSYMPGNFSSQFKKESSASTIVSGPGFQADLNYTGTAFINMENEMTLIISEVIDNQLGDFNISFAVPAETSASVAESEQTDITIIKSGGASWQVSGLEKGALRQEIPLKYLIKKRLNNPEITVRLEKKLEDGQSYVFWEEVVRPELVDSDLNLTMLLEGSKNDDALNFGQPLNYTLTYANKGSNTFKDVVIMAVLEGEFLDWSSLKDTQGGDLKSGSIIWSKNEVEELAEIKPGDAGEIKFSLNLRPWQANDLDKNLEIISFAQYGMNNTPVKGDSNKSNTITSRLNSDLKLEEKVLYFNTDNMPVGSGPLPPRVGEKTSVKVYWTVTNNIHELSETKAIFSLPAHVSWDGGQNTNVGSVYYDEASRQVIWEIGRLPISVGQVDADFNISITPSESDRNKILILSPGSVISAMDTETKGTITKKTGAKTTKLEDDDISSLNNSGIIQ